MQKIIPQVQNTKEKINHLNEQIRQTSEREAHLSTAHDDNQIKEISRSHHLVFGCFLDSISNVDQLISILENLRNEIIIEQSKSELQLPTTDKIRQMLKVFFEGSIKTRAAPIPTSCGCYAHRNKEMKEGNFICARIMASDNKPHYYLYIVAKYANNICEAYDPEKADQEMNLISLKDEDWTPLPTFIPERPLKRWEFSKDTPVLSLFPELDYWTTEFYQAKVLVLPSQRQNADVRGYELEFEGSSSRHVVPEKFIVTYSKQWQEADKDFL